MACAAIATVLLALGGAAATAGSPAAKPSEKSMEHLRAMVSHLDAAVAERFRRSQKLSIFGAADEKKQFVGEVYREQTGQTLFGCRAQASRIILALEELDVLLEMAARGEADRRAIRLQVAADRSRKARRLIHSCPGTDVNARTVSTEVVDAVDSLYGAAVDGTLGAGELGRGASKIARMKRDLLAGQTVYDCDVTQIYGLVKDIDLPLEEALDEAERGPRERLLEQALRSGKKLIELWKRAPCKPACGNGEDDDADGSIDDSDPGCRTGPGAVYDPDDRSEEHGSSTGLNCTSLEVDTPVDVFIGNPNSGKTITRHNLRGSFGVLVERDSTAADFTIGGPVDLDSRVCGPGTTATAEWVRSGTTMTWHLTVTKTSAGTVPPNHVITAAANTR